MADVLRRMNTLCWSVVAVTMFVACADVSSRFGTDQIVLEKGVEGLKTASPENRKPLVIYSGRSESLVAPISLKK